MDERTFETILAKYPELIESGLVMKGRQVSMYGRRMDLLFEDSFKRKLIIELKVGPIKDKDMGQVLSYEGMLLSGDDPTIRVMLIGNRVPPNIRRALDHHGIAWKEISVSSLLEHLKTKFDSEMLNLFSTEELGISEHREHQKVSRRSHESKIQGTDKGSMTTSADTFVRQFLTSHFGSGFEKRPPYRMMFETQNSLAYFQNFNKKSDHLWYRVTDKPWRELRVSRKAAWIVLTNPAERFGFAVPVADISDRIHRVNWTRNYLEINIDPLSSRWIELDWNLAEYRKTL